MTIIRNILAVGIIVSSGAAFASSPTSYVGSAKVNAGETKTEIRFGYSKDNDSASNDKRFQMRQHIDHGVNDFYAMRLVVSQDKRDGDNLEHEAFKFENRFHIIDSKDHGWDGGFRLAYDHKDGDKTPSKVSGGLFAQVPFAEKWEWRNNLLFAHDIGEDSNDGLKFEIRNIITKKVKPFSDCLKKLAVGLEMYNDFGNLRTLSGYSNQDHQFGPMIKGSFKNGVSFQTGYRAGISDGARDHAFKISFGRKF